MLVIFTEVKKSSKRIHNDGKKKKDILLEVSSGHVKFENIKRYPIGEVR